MSTKRYTMTNATLTIGDGAGNAITLEGTSVELNLWPDAPTRLLEMLTAG